MNEIKVLLAQKQSARTAIFDSPLNSLELLSVGFRYICEWIYPIMNLSWEGTMGRDDSRSESKPLRPVIFEILLLLNEQEMHGYGIMSVLKSRPHGRLVLGPGTLYRTIKEMKDRGLIRPSQRRPVAQLREERRQYYAVTPLGKRVAAAEARRMARLVETASLGGLLSGNENS